MINLLLIHVFLSDPIEFKYLCDEPFVNMYSFVNRSPLIINNNIGQTNYTNELENNVGLQYQINAMDYSVKLKNIANVATGPKEMLNLIIKDNLISIDNHEKRIISINDNIESAKITLVIKKTYSI